MTDIEPASRLRPYSSDRRRAFTQIPCYSLLWRNNSLLRLQKFPVPMFREFCHNARILQVNFDRKSVETADFGNIPCKIPCYGEMTPERARVGRDPL